ncbi:MAG: transglutaminase-like domain-containing protein [Maritimibacter sp.]
MSDTNLRRATPMLDFNAASIETLITARGWRNLPASERIGAAYDFVRNEIKFGYNVDDLRRASEVLADGYGQCNTKATLLMALLRGLDLPCRLHGFTIHKRLQRGVVPELIYKIAPQNILHSWVEVRLNDTWITLEGFILDDPMISALQTHFPNREALCGYGAGTDCLSNPAVEWNGADTFIQKTGINQDFGLFDAPDAFFKAHQQDFKGLRALLYRYGVRHMMNKRVAAIREGNVPRIPGL